MTLWQQFRQTAKIAAHATLQWLAPGPSRRIRVLTYHSVDDSGSLVSVTRQELRDQLRLLRDLGVRGLTTAEYAQRKHHHYDHEAAGREILITFDDGYENFALEAAPLLQEYGFPATVFVVPALMGQTASWYTRDADRIARLVAGFIRDPARASQYLREMEPLASARLMTWEQARHVVALGFEVGSHSDEHRFLTSLEDKPLARDLAQSRRSIREQLGVETDWFCYPYGDCDPRVVAAAENAGYRFAFLGDPALPEGPDLQVGRWAVAPRMTAREFNFLLSRAADIKTALRRLRRH